MAELAIKQSEFSEKENSTDSVLKFYVLSIVAVVFISYIGVLPENFQQIVTESIPGLSGSIIPVDEVYLRNIVDITQAIFSFSLLLTLLSAIFIIYKRNLVEILGVLFLGILPRERKVWGIVRDKTNYAPIPFSQIRLFKLNDSDQSKVQVQQNVADLDGRYRILFDNKEGKFFLEAKATGFKPYYKEISFINTLVNSDLIIDDILMERLDNTSSSTASKLSYIRPRINNLLIRFIYVFNILNIPLAAFITLNNPIIINWIFSLTAILTTIWNTRVVRERFYSSPGKILDKDEQPIQNVNVELFTNNQKLSSIRTSSDGTAKFDVDPGSYLIQIATSSKLTELMAVRINSKGYLDHDIKADLRSTGDSSLLNPFM